MTAEWRGKWALVTGASAGIGVALAEELALGGANLLLTARRKDRLDSFAQRLATTYKIHTQVFPADLHEGIDRWRPRTFLSLSAACWRWPTAS